jgi:putative phosphoesterase
MKIGLIADIHGHTEAFKQALVLFERLAVDQIVCAGDLIDFHTQKAAHEVIEILRTRQVPCVKGNHDAWWLEDEQKAPLPPEHQLYLSSEDCAYLQSLPLEWRTEWEGLRIYMTHASPGSLVDGLYFRDKEYLTQAVDSANADIIIVGHTHLAAHIQVGQTHIYNPGAVWSEFTEENATCAVLTLPDLFFQVYDLRTNMLRMISSVVF